MILMDDLQQHVIKSERQFAKELIYQVGQYYKQLNCSEENFYAPDLIGEWKNHRGVALKKILSWYSCDNGITPEAKGEIFSGVLDQCAKLGLFKIHMKGFRTLNDDDLKSDGHKALQGLLEEFSKAEHRLKQEPFNDKQIFKELEKKLKEKGAEVKQSKYYPQRQIQTDGMNARVFSEYIEKTLGDILKQCVEYEQTVSQVFGNELPVAAPLHISRNGIEVDVVKPSKHGGVKP